MTTKRKASEFFKNDTSFDDDYQNKSKSSVAPVTNVPVKSKAEQLKEARKKQLLDAVFSDTSKTSRASEYQSKSYAQWTRPEASSTGHSLKFEEKYGNFASKHNKRQTKSYADTVDHSNYFDKQDKKHNDAIFSADRRHSADNDSDSDSASDEDKEDVHDSHTHYGEKIMINSFSNVEESQNNSNQSNNDGYTPQSTFAKRLYAKHNLTDNGSNFLAQSSDSSLPLYKRIKTKDRVLARYNASGQHYAAVVKAVMHGGYSSAQFDIVFDGYDTVHTVNWTDIQEIITGDNASVSLLSQSTINQNKNNNCGVIVDVTEVTQPLTKIYNTVAGVSIKSIRYDSALGKVIVNEEQQQPSSAAASVSITSIANPVVADKVSDVLNRIKQNLANNNNNNNSINNNSINNNSSSSTLISQSSHNDTTGVGALNRNNLNNNSSYSHYSNNNNSSSNGAILNSIVNSVSGLSSAPIPLVNPKLAERTKGSWKNAKK